MGNQQERLLAWFTGVMEAEGSISVQVYTLPDGRVRLTPFVCIVNSDQGILDTCYAVMAELTKDERAGPRWCTAKGTNKTCRTIRVDGSSIKPILQAMLPYMRGDKIDNADAVLKYLEMREKKLITRNSKGQLKRAGYTREQVELVCSIRRHKSAKSSEAICSAPNVIG